MKPTETIAESLFLLFRLMHGKAIGSDPANSRHGMCRSHYEVLFFLSGEGYQPMSRIALALGFSKPYITSLVNKLSVDGLVERIQNTGDKRIIHIKLTENGKTFIDEHKRMVEKKIESNISGLSAVETEELKQLTDKAVDILIKAVGENEGGC